jgi:hypothetical protein
MLNEPEPSKKSKNNKKGGAFLDYNHLLGFSYQEDVDYPKPSRGRKNRAYSHIPQFNKEQYM